MKTLGIDFKRAKTKQQQLAVAKQAHALKLQRERQEVKVQRAGELVVRARRMEEVKEHVELMKKFTKLYKKIMRVEDAEKMADAFADGRDRLDEVADTIEDGIAPNGASIEPSEEDLFAEMQELMEEPARPLVARSNKKETYVIDPTESDEETDENVLQMHNRINEAPAPPESIFSKDKHLLS